MKGIVLCVGVGVEEGSVVLLASILSLSFLLP